MKKLIFGFVIVFGFVLIFVMVQLIVGGGVVVLSFEGFVVGGVMVGMVGKVDKQDCVKYCCYGVDRQDWDQQVDCIVVVNLVLIYGLGLVYIDCQYVMGVVIVGGSVVGVGFQVLGMLIDVYGLIDCNGLSGEVYGDLSVILINLKL